MNDKNVLTRKRSSMIGNENVKLKYFNKSLVYRERKHREFNKNKEYR